MFEFIKVKAGNNNQTCAALHFAVAHCSSLFRGARRFSPDTGVMTGHLPEGSFGAPLCFCGVFAV